MQSVQKVTALYMLSKAKWEWVSEWVSEWVNEWVGEWVSEWVSEFNTPINTRQEPSFQPNTCIGTSTNSQTQKKTNRIHTQHKFKNTQRKQTGPSKTYTKTPKIKLSKTQLTPVVHLYKMTVWLHYKCGTQFGASISDNILSDPVENHQWTDVRRTGGELGKLRKPQLILCWTQLS